MGNTPKGMRTWQNSKEKGKIDEGEAQGKDKMAKGQDGGIHDGFDQMGLSGLLI